jgi:hypothetical protein
MLALEELLSSPGIAGEGVGSEGLASEECECDYKKTCKRRRSPFERRP